MIYTVTFNPSLDYIVSVDDFMLGRVNVPGRRSFIREARGSRFPWC